MAESAETAHRSTPVHFTASTVAGRLDVTVSLYQAHAAWLTAPYLDVEFAGLECDWAPISGALRLPVDQAVELTRLLANVAHAADVAYAAQIKASLSSPREEVRP